MGKQMVPYLQRYLFKASPDTNDNANPTTHMAVHHLHHLHYQSPLASSLTRSVFHSALETWLFSKSFPP